MTLRTGAGGEKKKSCRHAFVLAERRQPSVDSRDDEPPKGEAVGVVFVFTARAHQADTKACTDPDVQGRNMSGATWTNRLITRWLTRWTPQGK